MQKSDPFAALIDSVMKGLVAAQKDQTRGISFLDWQRGVNEVCAKLPAPSEIHLAMLYAYKQDKYYSTKDWAMYSAVPLEDYKLMSEWMATVHHGYKLNDKFIIESDTAPKLNFKKHMDMLLQPFNGELTEEMKEFEKHYGEFGPMFLDGEKIEQTFFASFPRSGNTWLRKLLEVITGIITGSDENPFMALLVMSQTMPGFRGEHNATGYKTWVNKTHFPLALPMAQIQSASKVVICIRSPFDAAYSAFNLLYTQTHNKTVKEETFQEYFDEWNDIIKIGTDVYIKSINYWREVAEKQEIPAHIFRFEDMKVKQREVLTGIMAFLLNGKDIKGTYLEHRLDQAIADSSSSILYKPRASKVLHDKSRFTPEQHELFEVIKGDHPYFFGWSDPEDPANCFYAPEPHDPTRETFRTINAKSLAVVSDPEYKPTVKPINKAGQGVKGAFFEPSYLLKMQKAQLGMYLQDH